MDWLRATNAVVRHPDAMRVADQRLRVIVGDVLQPASLPAGIAEAGAVLSALGSRTMRRPTTVYSAGTAAVLGAMREAGVRRFIGITAAPVGPRVQQRPLDRYLLHPLLWWAPPDQRRPDRALPSRSGCPVVASLDHLPC